MSATSGLRATVEAAFERRADLTPKNLTPTLATALEECLTLLDRGQARVAEPRDGGWVVNEWLKKAVLLYFRTHDNRAIDAGFTRFFDKVPLKYADASEAELRAGGARIVPHAIVRRGAYIAPDAVLMPSYVNIGAWVGAGTMVDTWATVGSCAQIGRNVHLSGGAGIGGVLEPPSAVPVVVEDDAFIGSRSMVVEGARVRTGAKLGAGTILTATTHVIDTSTGQELPRGEAPAWSVCVNGTRSRSFPGGEFGMQCVLVLKRLPEGSGHDRLALNEILRDHGVSG